GGDRRGAVLRAHLVVLVEEARQVDEYGPARTVPVQRPPGDAARLVLVADLVADLEHPFALLRRPFRVGDGRRREDLEHEPLERVVHQRAAVDRSDLHDLLGVLDRAYAEDRLDEVGERTTRPRLQPGGRGDARDGRWQCEAGEVAVEARERRT